MDGWMDKILIIMIIIACMYVYTNIIHKFTPDVVTARLSFESWLEDLIL